MEMPTGEIQKDEIHWINQQGHTGVQRAEESASLHLWWFHESMNKIKLPCMLALFTNLNTVWIYMKIRNNPNGVSKSVRDRKEKKNARKYERQKTGFLAANSSAFAFDFAVWLNNIA